MTTLAMTPVQSWVAIGSIIFIVIALLWLRMNAIAEAAKSAEDSASDVTEQEEDLGAGAQTNPSLATAEPVLAAIDTAATGRLARRRLHAVARLTKRSHLSVVPPLVSTTSHPDRAPSKVYDWSKHGL